ncbi:MAG: hypothetical protein U0Q16_12105 [Bryobacteraceae bacterium]
MGSKRCQPCHPAIFAKFGKTAMGASMARPDPALVASEVRIENPKFQRTYGVSRQGSDLWQTITQSGVPELRFRLEYAIGSGANGISFAVRRGNHLFQAPLSYYARTKQWELSPGYEETGEGFNRPIYEDCIVCHAGRPRAVARRDGLFEDPPFAEAVIGCENCHGPGALHVSERARGGAVRKPDTAIVNPRHLEPRRADDICMQCHQGGAVRVLLPGRKYSDFRPGSKLVETLAIFNAPASSDSDLLEHDSSMRLSACFRGSSGKLGCITCHDPHQEPADPVTFFRAKCRSCHTESACKAIKPAQASAANCIGCHMPRREIGHIAHSALTNHRIPARAADPPPAARAKGGLDVVNGDEGTLPLITRLTAYASLASKFPQLQPKYAELLEQAEREAPEDAIVLEAQGRRAMSASNPGEAAALLSKAEAKGATGPTFYLDLGEALALSGKQEESGAALERGAALFPWSPPLRKRLVLSYIQRKEYVKAKAAMERYTADFPEDEFMRKLLLQVPR